jgi:S1-C subfamily serine protease
VATLATAAVAAVTAVAATLAVTQTVPAAQPPRVAAQDAGTAAAPDGALTRDIIANVAAAARPGVVQITNEQQTLQGGAVGLVPAGVGTGFVIDQQGHILTNNHVVADAQRLQVQTTDGKSFPATLTGRDPLTDLAVVQVQAPGTPLPAVPMGASASLVPGQWVVAIGNALALEGGPTITAGVVSAVGRTVQEPGDQQGTSGPFLFDLVQTDAAINPGNSGGPLLDLQGQVIGINTLGAGMAEPGVQAQGISFAIAIDTARRIADQLISTGSAQHAFLGVATTPNTPSLAARFGLPTMPGMAVAQVQPGSPAAQAGVQPRDVITAMDNQPLTSESDLSRLLFTQHAPGDTVTLTVARDGQTLNLTVTLGTAPQP